ncbi:methyltransferase domain-containing protein [Sphingomonas sp. MAH-20]|uniref:Methyltransferase domain-containing protein n=1 Tax=Sphingomonas horti TaxID=2682842 RepID=A0A6I4J0F1_9SPHN|nr:MULTISPECIES: class I SAM-dependent methyltransferase [Sphingomonas]MBA2919789.1 methyltransferase regulatory domain-containing protein [Sphingomonas sp. CGMCC 1.13658]MVO78030.1 methyltransferase domain-containing protein [Sphingomonas horti]
MTDWTHGYNIEQGYTYGVYRELAPDWMDVCAMLAGFAVPSEGAQGQLRYLELGCGQGFGLALIASAYPQIEFVGVDFSPEHIAHARGLAHAAGLDNVRFVEADFLDLARDWPPELGRFDYAVLHGIYSWVPPELRHAIVGCLGHALVSGGLAYVSYNSMPGWAAMQPFQHIAARLQTKSALPGAQVLNQAVSLFQRLKTGKAALFDALPGLGSRIDALQELSPAYLVQEYLHDNWHPLWFSEVAGEMRGAKLDFVASATLPENLLPAMLAEPMRTTVGEIADPMAQQDVIDCAINQSFRRDLLARGRRRRFAAAPGAADLIVEALARPAGDTVAIKTSFGEFTLKEQIYGPVFDALQDGPRRIAELLARDDHANVLQGLILLAHGGHVAILKEGVRDFAPAQRFNRACAGAVLTGAPYSYVAAPAIGSALALRDVDLMLIGLRDEGVARDALVPRLLESLDRLGRRLLRDGRPVEGDEAQRLATELVDDVIANRLPAWQRLGVVS